MGGETQSVADGRRRSEVSEIREVRGMMLAIRQALEAELARVGYRRVELYGGTVWVPADCGPDWPQDLSECVSVYRRSKSWVAHGVCRAAYGVATYRYTDDQAGGHLWSYLSREADFLWAAEAAACEAVGVALARGVAVCIDDPVVMHGLGDAGLRLARDEG
jgi:hypothetical protein